MFKPLKIFSVVMFFFLFSILLNYVSVISAYNSLWISTTLLSTICLILIFSIFSKKINLIEPIVPISITYLLFFCARPLYILIEKDYDFLNAVDSSLSQASIAQWVVLSSFFFFLIGYFIINSNVKIEKPTNDFNFESSKWIMILIFLFTAPIFLVYLKSNGPIGYGNVVENELNQNAYFYQSKLILFTLGYSTVALYLVKKIKLIFMLIINIPVLWIIFTGGSRIPIIIYFLAVLVLWIVIRKSQNKTIPYVNLIIGGSFLIIIMNWIGRIRSNITSAGLVGEINYSLKESMEMMFSSKGDFNIFDTWSKVFANSEFLPKNYGTVFIQLLSHPIPRSIWPSKPGVTSEIYMEMLMPNYFYKGIGFSSSILGDYLMMFGNVGIFILMFFSGLICKMVYLKTLKSSKLSSWIMYAPFYGWLPLIIRGEIVTTSVLLLAYLLPLLLIVKYTSNEKKVRNLMGKTYG